VLGCTALVLSSWSERKYVEDILETDGKCDMYREWKKRVPKRVWYMSLESKRPRGRTRNRWQDEVREDGRIVGGEEWQEKVYNREEWKTLLRTARNRRILHMPME
jgi:hypothetical protein